MDYLVTCFRRGEQVALISFSDFGYGGALPSAPNYGDMIETAKRRLFWMGLCKETSSDIDFLVECVSNTRPAPFEVETGQLALSRS